MLLIFTNEFLKPFLLVFIFVNELYKKTEIISFSETF